MVSETADVLAHIKAVPPKCHGSYCDPYHVLATFRKLESLRNVLGQAVKWLTLLSLNPWVHILIIFSMIKLELCIKPVCLILEHYRYQGGHLYDYLIGSSSRHHFYRTSFLLERMTGEINSGDLVFCIWQTFSLKWMKWACHIKAKCDESYLLLGFSNVNNLPYCVKCNRIF